MFVLGVDRLVFSVLGVFALLAASSLGQEYSAGNYGSPAPPQGIKKLYINGEGAFFLAGVDGAATYEFEGKGYWSKLVFVKAASLAGGEGVVEQGFIYKDKDDPFYIFFSQVSFVAEGQRMFKLYFSFDGANFTRWLTKGGTKRHELDEDSVSDFQGLGGGGPGGPPNSGGGAGPDGKKTKFPIEASESVSGGSADVTVFPEGIIKIQLKGKHSGITGRTKYSCAVVLSGYKNGEPYVILNRVDTETLTVGANSVTGTAKKDKSFTQDNAFASTDRYNIRNIRVLLEKDKSGENFVDTVKGMLQSAGEIYDEAEALYQKIKNSELGQDVAAAAAGS